MSNEKFQWPRFVVTAGNYIVSVKSLESAAIHLGEYQEQIATKDAEIEEIKGLANAAIDARDAGLEKLRQEIKRLRALVLEAHGVLANFRVPQTVADAGLQLTIIGPVFERLAAEAARKEGGKRQ